MKVRRVEWADAEGGTGWYSKDAFDRLISQGLPLIVTVGFLYEEFDTYIMVVQSLGDSDECHADNFIKIPKVWIKKQEELRMV